VYNIKSV